MNQEGAPVLAHHRVTRGDGEPRSWLYMLHGIFGSGRNWASVARRLVQARPEWGVVLVDLREHGSSTGFPPPHTLDACAADLRALSRHLGLPVDALLGHSFGGKVALAFAEGSGRAGDPPRQLWIVDSTPDPQSGGSAWEMMERIRRLPDRFPSRDALVRRLGEEGVAEPVARWMATNLEGDPDAGYRWRFNLAALEDLLEDFGHRDLWRVLEAPPGATHLHLIKAEESALLSGPALTRVERIAAGGRVHLHRVAGGHWVNADNPDALHTLLEDRLGREG